MFLWVNRQSHHLGIASYSILNTSVITYKYNIIIRVMPIFK